MLTLAQINSPEDCRRAPQIPREELRLLWHADFCDGPRSGMLLYQGEECWFQIVAESEEGHVDWYRRFVVLKLTADQHADECKWHELFRSNVGVHTDYNEQQERHATGFLWPRENWDEFYDPYRQRIPPDLSGNEVLGWFEH